MQRLYVMERTKLEIELLESIEVKYQTTFVKKAPFLPSFGVTAKITPLTYRARSCKPSPLGNYSWAIWRIPYVHILLNSFTVQGANVYICNEFCDSSKSLKSNNRRTITLKHATGEYMSIHNKPNSLTNYSFYYNHSQ